VLELGALERSKSIITLEGNNFRPFLVTICKQFEQLCTLEQIPFTYSIVPEDMYMQVSVFHLENAINNLLDNARKYGLGRAISLKAEISKQQLEICIQDNGPGIPQEEQEKIFRKYYRISSGNRQDVRGYGLGLSYVKTVLERHYGRIFVKSDSHSGTAFILRLPLENYGSAQV
jgi:two-component system phosphate regulon sensor histidine kinase PhoR